MVNKHASYPALHGARLWMGMELDYMVVLGLAVFLLGVVIMRVWSVALAVGLAAVGGWAGRQMARKDDRLLGILWRSVWYQRFYPARDG